MNTTLEPQVHPWDTHPGWGISVDLTPREILSARRARVHKRLIGAGLVLVAVVCTGVTLMALDDRSAAEDAYDTAQARTTELQAEAARYDEITMLTSVTAQIAAQVESLMATDLDFVHLMTLIRSGVTPHLAITNESILLAPAVVVAAPPAGEEGAVASDVPEVAAPVAPAGPQIIGSVNLAGTGQQIRDLAPFIAILSHLPGVVDVVPTSTSQTETGMTFTLSMNITDELYTHRFDQAAR